jgi:aryl-alcohol dehydrogenase-like predicted oxidoreductase
VIFAGKTKERFRDGSLRMLEESLRLLHTDHVDIRQLHDIGRDMVNIVEKAQPVAKQAVFFCFVKHP